MSNFCSECFREFDPFDPCEHQANGGAGFEFGKKDPFDVKSHSATQSARNWALFASPFAGLLLDVLIPNWSNLMVSVSFALLGGSLFMFVWRQRTYKFKFNPVFYIKNFPQYLLPTVFQVTEVGAAKKTANIYWGAGLVLAVLSQVMLFTPGNAKFLESDIRNYIQDTSSVGLEVQCPEFEFKPLGGQLTCEVETGVFGITVPARVWVDAFVGNYESIKVSLN